MSGMTLIGKDQLELIKSANIDVLETARKLLAISQREPSLQAEIAPLVNTLLTSGTYVNTAMSTIPGITAPERRS